MCALVGALIKWFYEMHGATMKIEFNYFMVPTAVPQLDHGISSAFITLYPWMKKPENEK